MGFKSALKGLINILKQYFENNIFICYTSCGRGWSKPTRLDMLFKENLAVLSSMCRMILHISHDI